LQVVLQGLRLEARQVAAVVAFGDGAGIADGAAQETAPEGAEGDEGDAQLSNHGQYLGFRVAGPQRIFGLQRRDGVNSMGAADGLGSGLRQAQRLYLARLDQARHGADGLLDGRVGIDPVQVIEVDGLDAEALQRGLAGSRHIVGTAIDADPALGFRHLAELGGQHHRVAEAPDDPADQLFVVPAAVDVGGVEQGDAEFDRLLERGGGLRIVALVVTGGHGHAAEPDGGNFERTVA
jgi:hypothetical protein